MIKPSKIFGRGFCLWVISWLYLTLPEAFGFGDHQGLEANRDSRPSTARRSFLEIAHGEPVHNFGRVQVEIGEGQQTKMKRLEPARMQLYRNDQTSKTVWTTEQLTAEYFHANKLFGHLIAFVKRLRGEPVPEHLEQPFDPTERKVKKSKSSRRA
jgi:hypothetical protein